MADEGKEPGLNLQELQTLLLTGQAMSQEQSPDRICRWVADAASSLTGASLAAVALAAEKLNSPGAVYGEVGDIPLSRPLARDLSKLAEMQWPAPIRPGGLATLEKAELPSGLIHQGIYNVVRVPVRTINQELGALIVGTGGSWEPSSQGHFILTTQANQGAVALENARLRREADERAHTLRALIQASPLAIIARDRDTVVQMWNPAAERIFGWSEEEVLGRPYPLVPEEKQEEFRANIARALRGEALDGLETRRQKKDGTLIDVGIWTAPLRDAGAMVVVADITERKRAEEALQELAVLEERNRLAREIHDTLAQGLTGIIWQLNGLERSDDIGDRALPSLTRIRDMATASLQQARRSVWDLRKSPLEGLSLSEELRQEAEKISGDGRIKASVSVSGDAGKLPSEKELALLRIYQESLANIVKYSEATEVTATLAHTETEIRLAVRDNGIGFDPGAWPRRGSNSGGFGLISMRERARLLGGELNIESSPGKGTLVEAILPLD